MFKEHGLKSTEPSSLSCFKKDLYLQKKPVDLNAIGGVGESESSEKEIITLFGLNMRFVDNFKYGS